MTTNTLNVADVRSINSWNTGETIGSIVDGLSSSIGDKADKTDLVGTKIRFSEDAPEEITIAGQIEQAQYMADEAQSTSDRAESKADIALTEIPKIQEKIPASATSQNQLADKAFVNSSINNFAAFYITKNADGDAFATKAELMSSATYYSGGQVRVPTKNDYCIVLEDETKTTSLGVHPTTRYTYQGVYPDEQWEFQYVVNNTALTQAQVNAINSGITSQKVSQIDTDISNLSQNKADKSNVTAATKCKVTYNSDGIITSGANLAATDIPSLAATKITSGTFAGARLPIATSTTRGAVKPVAKTSDMT